MIYTLKYSSPLGGIVVACDGEALTGLWFEGQKYFGDTLPEQYEEKEAEKMPVLGEAKRWLDIYFSGRDPGFTPPLAMEHMTEFRRQVCEIMLDIPFGETMTYGQIAKRVAQMRGLESMSSQGRGRCGRSQSGVADNTMPQSSRHERKPDGICRRDREEDSAAQARRCRHDRLFYP